MSQLLLICGSLRAGSYNRKLLEEAVRKWDGETVWADLDMPLYNGDVQQSTGMPAAALKLETQIAESDAVLISSPEYNQSLSGVIKNALDWVSRGDRKPWSDKPVAIMSAAAGRAGGARAQFALRLALNPFQPRLLTGPEVMVANASNEFDEDGRLSGERYLSAMDTLLAKLAAEARR